MLGFQTKSSPTVDKWVHVYISGERLEENVGIARCKKLKYSAWVFTAAAITSCMKGTICAASLPFSQGIGKPFKS